MNYNSSEDHGSAILVLLIILLIRSCSMDTTGDLNMGKRIKRIERKLGILPNFGDHTKKTRGREYILLPDGN